VGLGRRGSNVWGLSMQPFSCSEAWGDGGEAGLLGQWSLL
jgi:hypothetical protein